jgi:hypothetical protein
MTIAEANVNLKLALPQGWTKTEVEDHLNDLLTELQGKAQDDHGMLLEFDATVMHVDADPFITSKVMRLPLAMR